MLKAPFRYFGGKSRIARQVWERLGEVPNYIEPFCGSAAVLLARAQPGRFETINDMDGLIVNFWRAIQHAPAAVARHADRLVSQVDLYAQQKWMIESARIKRLPDRLRRSRSFYDAEIAGIWLWGMCCSIGDRWSRAMLQNAIPTCGVARGVFSAADPGQVLARLHGRLRGVRILCGEWDRCCSSFTATTRQGLTGVFLDPPYGAKDIDSVYRHDSRDIAADVRTYCLDRGKDPLMRIALAGYAGEGHEALERRGWKVLAWKATGGYANQSKAENVNAARERIWFSPHCLPAGAASRRRAA